MIPLALLAMTGLVVAAVKLTGGPNLARVAQGTGLLLQYVQYASRAARANDVPLEWVLATILVESHGKPGARGDADGRSVGLMQVNISAHAKDVTLAQMLDPAQNISWGTRYLAGFKEDVLKALSGRVPPAPLDELTRLAYKGPTTVKKALAAGQNPLGLSWAPAAITNWRRAMAQVRAAMGKQTA